MAHEGGRPGSTEGKDLAKILQNVGDVRNSDAVLQGLTALRALFCGPRGDGAAAVLRDFLATSPDAAQLQAAWDKQLSVQNHTVTVLLLQTFSDMLSCSCSKLEQPQADDVNASLDALAAAILSRRLKALYFHLTSENIQRATAALELLASICKRSSDLAHRTISMFDWSLSSLPRLARPPRAKAGVDTPGKGLRSRGARPAFIGFGLTLLRKADTLHLQTLLQLRPLMGGLLNHLALDPPATAYRILGTVAQQVLHRPQASGLLPPPLQAKPFTDSCLAQLIELSSQDGGSERADKAKAVGLASDVIRQLCLDPAHGLCPSKQQDIVEGVLVTTGGHGGATKGQRGRYLRLLTGLRPEVPLHCQILLSVAATFPGVACSWLAAVTYQLEPECTARWFAAVTVMAAMVRSASQCPLSAGSLSRQQRSSALTGLLSGRAAVRPQLRAIVARVAPKPLSKAALSRGVQHGSALVQHATLTLLCEQLRAAAVYVRSLLEEAVPTEDAVPHGDDEAGPGGALGGSGGAAAGWYRGAAGRLRGALRPHFPDLQAVLSLYTNLQRSTSAGSDGGSGVDKEGDTKGEVEAGFGRNLRYVLALTTLRLYKELLPAVSKPPFPLTPTLTAVFSAILAAAF
mmetsp:Transcript_13550/g.38555  ORF Transcript_13550/g.38555 Transcript_13550/m.38555 type:complete len:631 (-) Transcript_13550:2704-4596(-)